MIPVVVNTTVFAIMAGTVAATWIKGEAYFWFSMFLLVLTGATTSVFQIAVFAEASRFPSRYVQAVMRYNCSGKLFCCLFCFLLT